MQERLKPGLFPPASRPLFHNSISKDASENLSAGNAASCSSGMNEYDLYARQCVHSFRSGVISRENAGLTNQDSADNLIATYH